MPGDLSKKIVRILNSAGTGFLVTADGLSATCSHVVRSEDAQRRGAPWHSPTATSPDHQGTTTVRAAPLDCAFLRCMVHSAYQPHDNSGESDMPPV